MYNSGQPPSGARSPDSWVEIPSRPSATFLHSANDASSPTSPAIRNDATIRRRERIVTASPLHLELPPRPSSVSGSSQEEYEESESESDRVMTSSNEGLPSSSSESGSGPGTNGAEVSEGEEDETRTALGGTTGTNCFTPQPNAFSHPPSSQAQTHSRSRSSVSGSYFPHTSRSTTGQRHSYPSHQSRQGHSPYNTLSPNHQADHDAALRASLTTLLSLGAAARGLPKKSQPSSSSRPAAPTSTARVDTTTLRTVPESVALGLDRPSLPPRRTSSTPSSSDRNSSPAFKYLNADGAQTTSTSQPTPDRPKRKAQRSSSKDRERQRLAKKPRRMIVEEGVSPTLLTWVVSAGVLVLVSALSFSAGYKVGKETARFDAGMGVREGGSCAKEAGRTGMGLRRLRWGGAAASAVSA